MGVVVLATHLQLDEPVALKFLRTEAVADSEALARFLREAKAAAKLKSEHVARVLDVAVTDEGSPYIVMEYLQGKDLSRTVQSSGPLDLQSAAEYLIQACEGLAEAHSRGIVHRDIKPENLFLVDRGEGWKTVKILDFGISKIAAAPGMSNFSTRSIMGSPCYMSPEQLRSTASVDHRTDIWALGVTLYELLVGKTPYDGGRTLPELVTAILENPPPRLSDVLPGAPPAITAIITRCLEKDRDKRFANVAELAVALLPFAPRRARTSVERALTLARPAGHSSGPISLNDTNYGPTVPPPAPGALPSGAPPYVSSPPSAQTLRAASGSNLLVRAVSGNPSGPGTQNPLSISAAPGQQSQARGRSKAGVWVAVAGVAVVAALLGSWQAMRGRSATTAAASGPAAAEASQAMNAAVAPTAASAAATATVAAPATGAVTATAEAIASATPPEAAAPSSASGPSATHRPVQPRPQHQAPSPSNPPASPERDLDIRMQR
jgi:serine/threonine-protein kinase